MTPKLLASEFSAKVKASNSIEENILRQRLDIYRRQEKTNLRMIEKDTKKYQDDFNDKFLRNTKPTNSIVVGEIDLDDDLRGDVTICEDSIQKQRTTRTQHEQNKPSKKKRKKRTHKREPNAKLSREAVTTETYLYKNAVTGNATNELQNGYMGDRKGFRSPCFFPRLHMASSTEQLTSKPTKTDDNLSLPPIHNTSLTSSVSLPSLQFSNKKY